MAYLVLLRHGWSRWNALGLWTGLTDITLSKEGITQANKMAHLLKGLTLHRAYTSALKRAKETLQEIKKVLFLENLPTSEHDDLNERDYGALTGKNKWAIKKEYGEEKFQKLRRSWDHPVPRGETLKDVYKRVVPFYKKHIVADLAAGKNVIVSAHGNSLRALVKYLDNISHDKIADLEINFGHIYIYEISRGGKIITKEIRTTKP